jgi:hypothetical protein
MPSLNLGNIELEAVLIIVVYIMIFKIYIVIYQTLFSYKMRRAKQLYKVKKRALFSFQKP